MDDRVSAHAVRRTCRHVGPHSIAVAALIILSAPMAHAQASDPARVVDTELRAALFELLDGRPIDAVDRLQRLGTLPPRHLRAADAGATPQCSEDPTNAGGGKLILCAVDHDAFPFGGEEDRLFLLAESYDALGIADSLRAVGDRMLAGLGEGPMADLVRIQLLMHGDSVPTALVWETLTRGDSTEQATLRQAQVAYEGQHYDSAATMAASIPATSAADAAARWTRALALGRAGDTARASEALADLAHAYPDLPEGRQASLLAAQLALDAGDAGRATRTFAAVSDTLSRMLDAVARATTTVAAARALVTSRTADVLLIDGPALTRAKALAPPDADATERAALAAVRASDGDPAGLIRPTFVIESPRAVMARIDTGDVNSVRASLFVPDSGPSRAALAHGVEVLRAADLAVLHAADVAGQTTAATALQLAILRGQRVVVDAARDSIPALAARVQTVDDSLARLAPMLDSSATRVRAVFLEQVAFLRELASRNTALVDSIRGVMGSTGASEDSAVLEREGAASAAYLRIAQAVERGLPALLARHPAFALRDSITAQLARARAVAGELAQAGADAAHAIDTAVDQLALGGGDTTARSARLTLVAATARQRDAAATLTPLVERDLVVRRSAVEADLARDREAADFGAARAAFRGVLAAGEAATPAARDSAIAYLTTVLSRYPTSTGRAPALDELGELEAERADAQFATAQRAGGQARGDLPAAPEYGPAIAHFEELLRRFPQFPGIDAAAYTLGTLYAFDRQFQKAIPAFELTASHDSSPYRAEALFRLGDARFELASAARGDARRSFFAAAADAYQRTIATAPHDGDLYLLALYKLGWSYYSGASHEYPDGYRSAVDVFARLVDAYDSLPPDRQARLGLRGEAVEYMAVSFTQIGGAQAAERFFSSRADTADQVQVLRRIAARLRDQGDFTGAVAAYQELFQVAPGDTGALAAQREVIDIYQNRTLEPDKAQAARLAFVDRFAPGFSWSSSHPALAREAATLRQQILREAAQYELATAQAASPSAPSKHGVPPPAAAASAAGRPHYAAAVKLYERYLSDYPGSDSGRAITTNYADALFGAGDFVAAGDQYSRVAWGGEDTTMAASGDAARLAAQNAIVAFDSVLSRDSSAAGGQDSLFAAVDRYVARYPGTDVGRRALIEKGRRASQAGRWDIVAATFRTYVQQNPNDPFAPSAAKLVGDALYKSGQYAAAQAQWDAAAAAASRSGRSTLVDSLRRVETAVASSYADSLVRAGQYDRAIREVYLPYADRNAGTTKGADALRDAIETERTADSVARAQGDSAAAAGARGEAIELARRLVTTYPTYKYRLQYETLVSDLLVEGGQSGASVQALAQMIADNPTWSGRSDAELRLAARLDSLGRHADAAAQYERFAADYPKDARAHDALYNAAATYLEAGDTVAAARVYGTFATRFADDQRAGAARVYRMNLLMSHGDSAGAAVELAVLCRASPPEELQPRCARQAAQGVLATALAEFHTYQPVRLVIASRGQLTGAGIKRASARKQALLDALTRDFTKVIASGDPGLLSEATYYIGVAQWDYGNFLRDVELPASLSDAERTAAQQGAAQQAAAYYEQAKETWADLIAKAKDGNFTSPWVDRAQAAVTTGQVPNEP